MSSRKPKAPGVVTFAAVLFTIAGFFHGIEGLGAIFKKEYFNEAALLYSNLQVWGCALLILGSCRSRPLTDRAWGLVRPEPPPETSGRPFA